MTESTAPLRDKLLSGIDAMQLSLSDTAITQLLAYLQLLVKWNRAYNLTAVRDIDQMVSRHLLDSLSVLPFLEDKKFQGKEFENKASKAKHVADVGTGAGLPGLVLAIAQPQSQFELLDSNGKKIRFVKQAIAELQLPNVAAHQARIEAWTPTQLCDVVLSRAFASLSEMAALCEHLLAPNGRLLAMKGNYPHAELTALSAQWVLETASELKVPDEMGQRHLIILRRA